MSTLLCSEIVWSEDSPVSDSVVTLFSVSSLIHSSLISHAQHFHFSLKHSYSPFLLRYLWKRYAVLEIELFKFYMQGFLKLEPVNVSLHTVFVWLYVFITKFFATPWSVTTVLLFNACTNFKSVAQKVDISANRFILNKGPFRMQINFLFKYSDCAGHLACVLSRYRTMNGCYGNSIFLLRKAQRVL